MAAASLATPQDMAERSPPPSSMPRPASGLLRASELLNLATTGLCTPDLLPRISLGSTLEHATDIQQILSSAPGKVSLSLLLLLSSLYLSISSLPLPPPKREIF
jgi:hypothetical protein